MLNSPEVFTLTAIDEVNPDQSVIEKFWRSTYQNDTDRYYEAVRFVDRMVDRGFIVEYLEDE